LFDRCKAFDQLLPRGATILILIWHILEVLLVE
jgi:hypothetical protein